MIVQIRHTCGTNVCVLSDRMELAELYTLAADEEMYATVCIKTEATV